MVSSLLMPSRNKWDMDHPNLRPGQAVAIGPAHDPELKNEVCRGMLGCLNRRLNSFFGCQARPWPVLTSPAAQDDPKAVLRLLPHSAGCFYLFC